MNAVLLFAHFRKIQEHHLFFAKSGKSLEPIFHIQNYQLAIWAHGESISCSERIPCCAADTVPSPTSSLESCRGTRTHVTLRSLLRPHRMFAICMKQRRGHCHDYRDVANFRSIKSNCRVFCETKETYSRAF